MRRSSPPRALPRALPRSSRRALLLALPPSLSLGDGATEEAGDRGVSISASPFPSRPRHACTASRPLTEMQSSGSSRHASFTSSLARARTRSRAQLKWFRVPPIAARCSAVQPLIRSLLSSQPFADSASSSLASPASRNSESSVSTMSTFASLTAHMRAVHSCASVSNRSPPSSFTSRRNSRAGVSRCAILTTLRLARKFARSCSVLGTLTSERSGYDLNGWRGLGLNAGFFRRSGERRRRRCRAPSSSYSST
mmetsp:Transcript_16948/g.35411  ORF Transcript_16948/g.35411 Transcript_16948/m.35411 type:complete len:253 (-) Transcript_16948:312-1070(-)